MAARTTKSSSSSLVVAVAVVVMVMVVLCSAQKCHADFGGCIKKCFHECKNQGGKSSYNCGMDCFNACLPGGSGHPGCAQECVTKCIHPDPSKMGDCLGQCDAGSC